MKKTILTTIICIVATSMGYAQFSKDIVLQPTSVVAKCFDESGQLIKEMQSTYTYQEDGKLIRYDMPDHSLWSTYSYYDNLLMTESTSHGGGHPQYFESFNYTYENEQVKTKSHLYDAMESSEYWMYSYNEEGRLERTDYKDEYDDDYHRHWLYEYENEGKTKIESYYSSYQGFVLVMRTAYEYDEAFNLLSAFREKYNASGEPTQTTLTTHSYTPSGEKAAEVTQTLIDGEWVNTSIIRYVYDENDRVTERQVGVWSNETSDWYLTNRITYVLNEEEMTLTVSFYKKENEEWEWDNYHSQPVFYVPYLTEQQHALRFFAYDPMFESENISQFVFTLDAMNKPTYVVAEKRENLHCTIHPNPTNGMVTVAGTNLSQAMVVNSLGQCVATAQGEGGSLTVDISGLPAGIYFVNITDSEGRKCVRKVVKE